MVDRMNAETGGFCQWFFDGEWQWAIKALPQGFFRP
jgi:hypothetical protein